MTTSTHQPVRDKEFTLVMRGPSAVVFLPGENLFARLARPDTTRLVIGFTSRWIKKSEDVTLPGHLWIEIKGTGESLEDILSPWANAGLALLPVLSLSANAAVQNAQLEIAFDSSNHVAEREYFQSYVPPESNLVHFVRRIDVDATVALIDAINRHDDADRLRRAADQYRLALDEWRLGQETLTLAHLWMALEALTKAWIRAECRKRKLKDDNDLATALAVELKQLDSVIRRDMILKGDLECYRKAKKASDGFEHGFLEFGRIRELATDVRHRMAGYIRGAILDLCELDEPVSRRLTSGPFDKPLGYWPVVKYMRGRLVGSSDQLAAPGNAYPFLRWDPGVKKCEVTEQGEINVRFTDSFTGEFGEGTSFVPTRHEAWQAD